MKLFKKLIRNKDGNIALMGGVSLGVLALGIGVAIDSVGMHKSQEDMQRQLDIAALTAVIEVHRSRTELAIDSQDSDEQLYAEIVAEALENNQFNLNSVTPEVTRVGDRLRVSATIEHTLQFGSLLNKPSVNINAISEVTIPGIGGAPVEIALVLDNTHSMGSGGKMTALRQAVREFVDDIEETGSGSKIAFVPFARYVDVGIDKRDEPWLDVPDEYDTDRTWEQATHTGGTCNIETQTRFNDGIEEEFETNVCTGQTTTYETMHRVVESRWIGCVGARSDGLNLVDGNYSNSDTKIPGLLHKVPHEVTGFYVDLGSYCPHTIIPLTDDYQFLRNQVGELYGTDRTYIPTGLIWGQRVLSPEAPFTEADTANPKRQIMVLMSDGQNTGYLEEPVAGFSYDNFETLPYIRDLNHDEQEAGILPPNTSEETATLCESVKASGIEIYTIAFQVNDTFTRNLLSNCASSSAHYFNANTNLKLVQSFGDISESLEANIRLAR